MDDEKFALLALSLTRGIGIVKAIKAVKEAGGASALLDLKPRHLRGLGISGEAVLSIVSGESARNAEEALKETGEQEVRIIGINEAEYPGLLKEIFDPPLVFYAAGDPGILQIPAVSVVGARRCSVYGEQVTSFMAREFSEMGLCVVSGMARGIDARAHFGALAASGPTVAVLGTGVDVPYPRENRGLYRKIRESGCVVSEFPMGSYPAPQNFPIRNRIISGLSWGTLITEAAEFSGSLITARLALEQDREVFAVPGNITCKTSYGPNYLIKQGAHPLLSPAEIVDHLPVHVLRQLRNRAGKGNGNDQDGPKEAALLSADESRILQLLYPDRGIGIDSLAGRTGFSWPRLNGILLKLESRGVIKRVTGNHYCRCL